MSSSDGSEFKTEITADPSSLVSAFRRAGQAAGDGAAAIKGHMGSLSSSFEALGKPLMAITALLAGGKFFKEAIAAAQELTGEQMKLSKRLGITGTEASALATALGDIGTDSETYIGAFDKFAKQLRTNEAGLQAMGLQTRDANGHLRDSNTLYQEALKVVGQYKPGLDQTTAAQTLFGKSVDEVMKLQKLNNGVIEEARKKNAELGMVMTQEGVDASKAYNLAMNDLGDIMLAVKNVIGQAVMPIFTRLAEWFSGVGPTAVFVFKTAINAVATALQGVVLVAKAVWTVISALVDPLFTFGSALKKLIEGDMKGATADMMNMGKSWGDALAGAFDKVKEDATRTWKEVGDLWGKGTEVGAPKGGDKTMGDFGKTNKKDGATKEPSRMGEWEAALAEKKAAMEREGLAEGQLREMSKAEEKQYWDAIKGMAGLNATEKIALARKTAEAELAGIKQTFEERVAALQTEAAQFKNNTDERLRVEKLIQANYQVGTKEYEASAKRIVEIERQAADQRKQIVDMQAQNVRDARLAEVATAEASVAELRQLGLIDQEQVLQAQRQFEEQRNNIAREALQARLADAQADPDRNPVEVQRIQNQIEALEREHQARLGQIRSQEAIASSAGFSNTIGTIQQGWAQLLQKLGTGTLTIGGFIRGVFQTVANAVVNTLAQMAAQWMAKQLAMMVFGKAMRVKDVTAEAAKAGAGGIASMAAAPWPLNMGAPAFGAAMSAAALAFAPAASAAGGYDIPGSVNPIVQAHAREMILPAKHADVIRSLADGGSGSPAVGGGNTVHFHGQGGDWVHKDDLAGAMRTLGHNFAFSRW